MRKPVTSRHGRRLFCGAFCKLVTSCHKGRLFRDASCKSVTACRQSPALFHSLDWSGLEASSSSDSGLDISPDTAPDSAPDSDRGALLVPCFTH